MQTSKLIRLEFTLRGVLTVAVIILAVWITIKVWPVLLLLSVSLMLAAALLPFVEWLVGRGLSRAMAVLLVSLVLLLVLAVIGYLVVPALIEQVRSLMDRLPQIRNDVASFLERRQATTLAQEVRQFSASDVVKPDKAVDTGRRLITIATSLLTVVFMTIYLLLDARRVERFVYFAVPNRYHHHLSTVVPQLRRTVGGYIRGQLVTSGIITVFTFVVLWLLDVPNALSLAVLAGISDVIPLIGGLLAVIPSSLAALQVSVSTAIAVAIILIAYQEFENRVLVPRVYGSTLRLPTLVVFVALLIGAKLAGMIGALLSLPVAAALRVLLEYSYEIRSGHPMEMEPEDELFAPDEEPTDEEPDQEPAAGERRAPVRPTTAS